MSRVLAIAVALSAILFVAFAYPQEAATEAPAEATTASAGGETTANPCMQFEKQCSDGGSQMAPVQGGLGAIPVLGDAVKNQTMPNMQCEALKQACAQQGNAGLTAPPAAGGGLTAPPMNGSNPIGGIPTEIPGLGGMNNLTSGGGLGGMNNLTSGGLPIQMPAGMPGGRK